MIEIGKFLLELAHSEQKAKNKLHFDGGEFWAIVSDGDGRYKKIARVIMKRKNSVVYYEQAGSARVWKSAEEIKVVD